MDGSDEADVVVVGAGPAGSSAAALLARRGWDVLLLDRVEFPRDKTCGDGLTPRAIAALDRLGVLPELEAAHYQHINGALTVAPSGATLDVDFGEQKLGLPGFGMVVPRFELDQRLRRLAVEGGARFRAPVHVQGPRREDGRVAGVEGEFAGRPLTVRAPMTLLATGANIGLLRGFGILERMPPGFNAMRGYFTGIAGLSDRFEFYFDPQLSPGYGWVFPLSDGRANVGVALFSRERQDGPTNTRRALTEFLARHPRLAGARPDGPLKGFPLRSDFPAQAPGGAGFLLAGEALGLVHPATGEGIDLAIESAEIAARVVDGGLRAGHSPEQITAAYRRAMRPYASLFRGLHLVQRLAASPRAMNRLIRKAQHKPFLAHAMTGISLCVISPLAAFSPRVWWDLLS